MATRKLNVDAIRRILDPIQSALSPDQPINRRAFIKNAALAAVAVHPVSEFTGLFSDDVQFYESQSGVEIAHQGVKLWSVFPHLFGGSPRLTIHQESRNYNFELRGAYYPGTSLCADLECKAEVAGGQTRAVFKSPVWKSPVEVELGEWLTGGDGGGTESEALDLTLDERTRWFVEPHSFLRFRPNWILEFERQGGLSIEHSGEVFVGDKGQLSILQDTAPGFTKRNAKRRSRVSLVRGDNRWTFVDICGVGGWRLCQGPNAFSALDVDTEETTAGSTRSSLLFTSQGSPLSFYPGGGIRFEDDKTSIPIEHARLALTSVDGTRESVFMGRLQSSVLAKTMVGIATLSEDLESSPSLEIVATGDTMVPSFSPQVEFDLNLGDSVITHSRVPSRARLPFFWNSPEAWVKTPFIALHIIGSDHKVHLNRTPIHVVRPKDMLVAEFEFRGVTLSKMKGLVYLEPAPTAPTEPAAIIARLPPQHILEEAQWSICEETPSFPRKFSRGKLSGRTRLVIEVKEPVGLNVSSLLTALKGPQLLSKIATNGYQGRIEDFPRTTPDDVVTAVEFPYGIALSPVVGGWVNEVEPLDIQGTTELWHTRLDHSKDPCLSHNANNEARVRAIDAYGKDWTKGEDACSALTPTHKVDDFEVVMDGSDRKQILFLSAGYFQSNSNHHSGESIPGTPFIVSSQGAIAKLKAVFDPPASQFDMDGWTHESFSGQDGFVRLSYVGFLFPLGYPANFIIITRREFQNVAKTLEIHELWAAGLVKRAYIRPRVPWIDYTNLQGFPNEGRAFPFQRVFLDLPQTPPLCPPDIDQLLDGSGQWGRCGFWPSVAVTSGCDPHIPGVCGLFDFPLRAWDKDLKPREFVWKMPLIFVSQIRARGDGYYATLAASFKTKTRGPSSLVRVVDGGGQQITVAAPLRPGENRIKVSELRFDSVHRSLTASEDVEYGKAKRAAFYPIVDMMGAEVPVADEFSLASTNPQYQTAWNQTYITDGFDLTTNKGQTFLELTNTNQQSFSFPKDKAGGLVQPSIRISGLSRTFGPIAGTVEDFRQGVFKPDEFMKDLGDVKLLGAISLQDVLAVLSGIQQQTERIPRLLRSEMPPLPDLSAVNQVVNAIQAVVIDCQSASTQIRGIVTQESFYTSTLHDKATSFINSYFSGWDGVDPAFLAHCRDDAQGNVEGIAQGFAQHLYKLESLLNTDLIQARIQREIEGASGAERAALTTLLADLHSYYPGPEELLALRQSAMIHFATSVERAKSGLRQLTAILNDQALGVISQLLGLLTTGQFSVPHFPDVMRVFTSLFTSADPGAAFKDQVSSFLMAQKTQLVQDLAATGGRLDTEIQGLEQAIQSFSSARDAAKSQITSLANINAQIRQDLIKTQDDMKGAVAAAAMNLVGPNGLRKVWLDSTGAILQDATRGIEPLITNAISSVTGLSGQALSTLNQHLGDVQRELAVLQNLLKPKSVRLKYDWKPKLQDGIPAAPIFLARKKDQEASLVLTSEVVQVLDPLAIVEGQGVAPPTFQLTADLRNFTVQLLPNAPFLTLYFNQVKIESKSGESARVTVDLPVDGIEFGGPLRFVDQLKKMLGFNDGSGPTIAIDVKGISVGYAFALPPITLGAFSITDLRFIAGVVLPFTHDQARVRFALSERHRPFLVTAGILGGGGFISIDAALDKTVFLQLSIELGAIAQLELGVASGKAFITAGVYIQTANDSCQFQGFVRAGGHLTVIGLVSMSLEFFLGLTYERSGNESYVWGEASIVVEVELFLFSISVSIHCRKQFAGSPQQDSHTGMFEGFPDPLRLRPAPAYAWWDAYSRAIEA